MSANRQKSPSKMARISLDQIDSMSGTIERVNNLAMVVAAAVEPDGKELNEDVRHGCVVLLDQISEELMEVRARVNGLWEQSRGRVPAKPLGEFPARVSKPVRVVDPAKLTSTEAARLRAAGFDLQEGA